MEYFCNCLMCGCFYLHHCLAIWSSCIHKDWCIKKCCPKNRLLLKNPQFLPTWCKMINSWEDEIAWIWAWLGKNCWSGFFKSGPVLFFFHQSLWASWLMLNARLWTRYPSLMSKHSFKQCWQIGRNAIMQALFCSCSPPLLLR